MSKIEVWRLKTMDVHYIAIASEFTAVPNIITNVADSKKKV
jgi:hypothetical protein